MGEQLTYSISEAVESNASDIPLMYFEKSAFEDLLKVKDNQYGFCELFANMARVNALYMITRAGSGHIGSSFSSLDVVTLLYLDILKEGDRYFSSKGHDSPGLYAVQTALGILPFEKIHALRRSGGLPGHPDILTPGAHTNTGSLGMGVSKAKGFLFADDLLNKKKSKVFVLTGDGELQEGQFWESLTSISKNNDDRLVVIVDYNKVQSDTYVSYVSDLGNLEAKFQAFGLDVYRCSGHDYAALSRIIEGQGNGKPKIIIADTVKGKGVSFMEHTSMDADQVYYKYHSGAPARKEYLAAVDELLWEIGNLCNLLKTAMPNPTTVRVEPLSISNTFKRLIPSYSNAIVECAKIDSSIVALDADLVLDTGLIPFKETFPNRFVECGIAEQDMVSQAGTMALAGLLPIVHSFACFLTTRPIEQIYNVATERSKVIYVGSLAGVLPGGPGHSHQAIHDISFMSSIPNVICIEPTSESQIQGIMQWATEKNNNSSYIRLTSIPYDDRKEISNLLLPDFGKGVVLTEGNDFILFTAGPILTVEALKAYDILLQQGVRMKIISTPWLNTIDSSWLRQELVGQEKVIICENHSPVNGFGDHLISAMSLAGIDRIDVIRKLGVEGIPAFGRHDEVLAHHKLDCNSIVSLINDLRD